MEEEWNPYKEGQINAALEALIELELYMDDVPQDMKQSIRRRLINNWTMKGIDRSVFEDNE